MGRATSRGCRGGQRVVLHRVRAIGCDTRRPVHALLPGQGAGAYHLLKRGAEETTLPPGTVDIVLTSPPYFNLEMYTSQGEAMGEPSQSHIRYPDPSTWASQFLGALIRNAAACLKSGGYLCLNVSNNLKLSEAGLDLEGVVVEHALRAGFTAEPTLGMLKPRAKAEPRATRLCGRGFEPIFVFRKEGASSKQADEDEAFDKALASIPLPGPQTPSARAERVEEASQEVATPPTVSFAHPAPADDSISTVVPYYKASEQAWVVMCTCGVRMWFREGQYGPYYSCPVCRLTHGAHKFDGQCNSRQSVHERGEPLGIPCESEVKGLRHEAHALMDELWTTPEQRSRVYRMAAACMDMPLEECHVARFGKARCNELLQHLRNGRIC